MRARAAGRLAAGAAACAAALALAAGAAPVLAEEPPVRHELQVTVEPAARTIAARDHVTLPAPPPAAGAEFTLHAGLSPVLEGPGSLTRIGTEGIAERYRLRLPPGTREATLAWRGVIDHPPGAAGEEYARGQLETPGTIGPEGVFLTEATGWYPGFDGTVRFSLGADLPAGWDAVSQGERAAHEVVSGRRRVRWESAEPQEGICLMAGPWTEYARAAGPVQAMVFLRGPDPELANRYLDATERYLAMYADLIGPYPYRKWALVENFWETGYGMPSFTLLGPKVVRLPFIVNTSYPHEILHSWWGNSVWPDYGAGNWSEGLTAYLADFTLKEQGGTGAEYRQTTLQKYADYVLTGRDLPLTQFRSRHGSVTEAVGYGKALMLFHMLRLELGDAAFRAGLRGLYAGWKFRTADWGAVRGAFEKAAGRDLAPFFAQWVGRTGAPELRLAGAEASAAPGGYRLSFRLAQAGEGAPYRLRVPVAVTLEGRPAAELRVVETDAREKAFALDLPARPLRLDVDPEFDLFRRLHREEVPPALSQAFGAERALIVLPAAAAPALREGYAALAATLGHSGPGKVEVVEDASLEALPADRSVWLLGWENRFLPQVRAALAGYPADLGAETVRLEQAAVARAGHAVVVTARHPGNPALALLWIGADRAAAMEGLGRKLPHYHKYSYLAFEGDEPANVAKGRWPVLASPLTALLPAGDAAAPAATMGTLPRRAPLAAAPAAYSKERMAETIRALASDELEGRGFGTPGLEKAAALIAARFARAGLAPGGDAPGTFFQEFTATGGDPPRAATLRNVIGVLPGTDPRFAGESVVIGAHYDGLGRGWPGARAGDAGRVHPGADDNASGVAVLLELADALGTGWRPARTVVFAAFTGEEAGMIGSRHFVASGKYPAAGCRGMLNLDTVGRLGAGKLLVLGGATAAEWVHIFRGAGFLAGVDTVMAAQGGEAGDQVCFQEAGVPAVQLFTGPHPDYHRPTDRAEAIDPDGLVKVASVAKEALEYLAGRERPLTAAAVGGDAAAGGAADPGAVGRKVSLGTIPDFAWQGEGVRLDGVTPGSPAEKAGLCAGDVIVGLAGRPVGSLRDLSSVLKSLAAGDRVKVLFRRDGREATVEAAVEAR
jgi:hypothetical protein